jgi:phosphoribosylaminoimidazolecarboxamide formyltransferase/IMP cyclohydrolase
MSTRAIEMTAERAATEDSVPAALRVRRALLSVSDKTGIVEFAKGLRELGVEIVSTGGTAAELRAADLEVRDVTELTGSAEILDGRVKTLHPRLHAGILAVRDDPDHAALLEAEEIDTIDLVCVNLYPFERTMARRDIDEREGIENIDVGGPTMIRAAAKNHRDVAVVVSPESYDAVLAELSDSGGEISLETRHWLANEAFATTARYDAAISRWFGERYEDFPGHWVAAYEKQTDLAYGENPHQRAALYTEVGARSHVLSRVAERHGRELSFNNVLDLDSARRLLAEFDRAAAVIVKHNNPCGVAIADQLAAAYEAALACDPLSAFGGVVALNQRVDRALAERLHDNFIEVLIAPGYDEDAFALLSEKESIRILEDTERRRIDWRERDIKRVRGGLLVQEADRLTERVEEMEVVSRAQPSYAQRADLAFAWTVCRHVRSNAIVFAKGGATVGIGAGQMSRVDSVRIAIEKARIARGADAEGALRDAGVASDAFFPFPDGPEAAMDAGATAIVQPGGSKRDAEVIAACDERDVAMLFTHRRHFRH